MLVGSLQLPRPLLFPFIYPPNLCMLMFAAQRFVSGIVSPTRPILYGVRYCPPRHPSPTPPRRHRSAGVSEIWRVGSYGPMEVVHRVRGPQVSPVAVGRRSSEGGGGVRLGVRPCPRTWRRHTSTATTTSTEPRAQAASVHPTASPGLSVYRSTSPCRRVGVDVAKVRIEIFEPRDFGGRP